MDGRQINALGLEGKPRHTYLVSEDGRELRLSLTARARWKLTGSAIGYSLVTLGLAAVYLGKTWPPTGTQLGLVVLLGAVSLASLILVLWVLPGAHNWRFDRATDRFLRDNELVCPLGNLQSLRIHQESIPGQKEPWHCLSVVLNQGKTQTLVKLPPPATELSSLAHSIARYLDLPVHHDQLEDFARPEGPGQRGVA